MAPHYLGKYTTEVHEVFKYSSDKEYDKVHGTLLMKCKDLKLRSESSYEFVMNHLKKYKRCVINTKPDNNSLIRSVIVQLKTPKGLTSQIVQHQLAEYMASEVVLFFPIMEGYLKKYSILYNAYVKGIYNGTIWANNYMIGALSRMFNVKITVVSPYYSDVWNVFHKSAIPDVIIVSNSGDFGTKSVVTHFTVTCGSGNVWQCIDSDISVGELRHHSKESDGRIYGMNVFESTEKKMTMKAQKIIIDIEELTKRLKGNMFATRSDIG